MNNFAEVKATVIFYGEYFVVLQYEHKSLKYAIELPATKRNKHLKIGMVIMVAIGIKEIDNDS